MSATDLLLDLSGRGVRFWAEGDTLRYRAPKGSLSPEEKQLLKNDKAELMLLLEQASPDPASWHPLSFNQQSLWYLQQLAPDNTNYNLFQTIEIAGPLNVGALEQGLKRIIQRHGALRTTFVNGHGDPFQVVVDSPDSTLPFVDLSSLASEARQKKLDRILAAMSQQPFDLRKDLPLRSSLVRLASSRHLLILTAHHIAFDGWSSALLLDELITVYEATVTDRPSPLYDMPLQYADFARWQRGRINDELWAGDLDYWRRQLSDLEVLQLPKNHALGQLHSFRSGRESFLLPKELSELLRALARKEGATLFMALLTVFKTLLYRYSGQEDVAVGSPVTIRQRKELQDVIGFFVNTLVLRSDLNGAPSFRDLMGRVKETVLEALHHQNVPFVRVVQELRPERDTGGNPLFQVMFAFDDERMQSRSGAGLTFTPQEEWVQPAVFDLEMIVWESHDGLRGHINFNQELFDARAISQMAGHYHNMVESLIAEPDKPIDRLSMLSAEERERILTGWNQTQLEYDQSDCLHELFEKQVQRTPEAASVVFETISWTYSELNRKANQLCRFLQALGVGSGDIVGVSLHRSAEMPGAILAILKAGAAYLPIDPSLPEARQRFMISDAGIKTIITNHSGSAAFDQKELVICDLQKTAADLSDYQADTLPRRSNPDQIAYVIYTSGSTGRPKGVQVTHRSAVNMLHATRVRPGMTAGDTMLALTTLSFDISVLEIFLPLSFGARIIIAGDELARDGLQLAAFLDDAPVTFMQATPATWQMLVDAGWSGKTGLKILSGGEVLSRDLAEALLARSDSVWNGYGPTEAAVYTTMHKVEAGRSGPVPIGRPVGNVQTYILDGHLEPVPVGVAGDLYIGGHGVAEGYLKRPELNERTFLDDPFGKKNGGRLYRSGDLARYRPDGTIDFLGRRDHQVKIRGFRIELGEIESWLHRHEKVAKAVVVTREEGKADWRLVAYVVIKAAEILTSQEIGAYLRNQLPAYMVPSTTVFLDSLPLTASGKIDRRALPAPEWNIKGTSDGTTGPRNETEERLAVIWSQLLGLEEINRRDNFFDLGGHSLLAVRLLATIESAFDIRIPLVTLVNEATVEDLARILETNSVQKSDSSIVQLRRGDDRSPLFIVTAGYGDLLALEKAAAQLSGEFAVYGLQPPRNNKQAAPLLSLDDLVDRYVKAIWRKQPEGPYHLAGYCSGGLVAFEVAQRLTHAGIEVENLILMESPSAFSQLSFGVYSWLQPHIARLVPNPSRDGSRFLTILGALFADDGLKAHLAALAGYRATTYPEALTLLLARRSHVRYLYGPRRWRGIAGKSLQVCYVPGDHDNFLRGEHSVSLAQQLSELLHIT